MRLVVGSGGEIQRRRRPGLVAVPECDAPEAVDHDRAAARVGQLTDRCEVPGGGSQDSINDLDSSGKGRGAYEVERNIYASRNAATSTTAVSSNPNPATRQKS